MPITPVSGGALKMIMGEGALHDGVAIGVSELAPAFEEHDSVGGVITGEGEVDGHGHGEAEAVVLRERARTSFDASAQAS